MMNNQHRIRWRSGCCRSASREKNVENIRVPASIRKKQVDFSDNNDSFQTNQTESGSAERWKEIVDASLLFPSSSDNQNQHSNVSHNGKRWRDLVNNKDLVKVQQDAAIGGIHPWDLHRSFSHPSSRMTSANLRSSNILDASTLPSILDQPPRLPRASRLPPLDRSRSEVLKSSRMF